MPRVAYLSLLGATILLLGRAASGVVAPPSLAAESTWRSVEAVSDQDLRAAFADLKAGSGLYAPARAPGEDWAAATVAARDPRWAKWIGKRRASLDEWMASPRDDRRWTAGWLHDYVESATGAFLQWSPATPMPPDDAGHARQRGGWIAHVRFHNIDAVLEAARLARLGQGEAYGRWAAEQLDAYAEAYLRLPEQNWNGRSRLLSQSLDEAIGSLTLLEAVRLLRGSVTPARWGQWRDGLFAPLAANLRVSKRGDHNIAVWHACAIAAIGLEFDLPDLVADGLDGQFGVRQLLARNVSSDYFWAEMSFAYHDYVISALDELFIAAALRGKLEGLKRELLIAQDMLIAPLVVAFPDGSGPTLNDSPPNRPIPDKKLWSGTRRSLPTRRALAENARALDWANLIDPEPSPGPAPPAPSAITQLVPGLEAVQLVTSDWQALLRYGQRLETHAQQESLTYELQYRGTWLLRDDGSVGYGSPLYQGFFRRAAAQNVPLVNNDGELPWPASGVVTEFSATGSAAPRASVEHVNYQPGVTARRALSIEDGRFIDRLAIEAPAVGTLGFVFNFDCLLTPRTGLDAAAALAMPAAAFSHWHETSAYTAGREWSATLECPAHRFIVSVAGPDGERVHIGRAPSAVKPYHRTGLLVEATGAAAKFVISFSPEP